MATKPRSKAASQPKPATPKKDASKTSKPARPQQNSSSNTAFNSTVKGISERIEDAMGYVFVLWGLCTVIFYVCYIRSEPET